VSGGHGRHAATAPTRPLDRAGLSHCVSAAVQVRVVNVVDLMRLETPSEHPHGMSDAGFGALFTKDKPVIFAYRGYPWLICRLTCRRHGHDNLHVRGYKEQGTTTTPVRHGHAERPGPVPPGHGRDRPGAGLASSAGHVGSWWRTSVLTAAPKPASTATTAEITNWKCSPPRCARSHRYGGAQ
jgi:hypothetical protein